MQGIESLHTAKELPVFINGREESAYKAVWNNNQDSTAAIVSRGYKIIQHREVVESFIEACQRLNIKHSLSIRNYGNRIFADVVFPDTKIGVQKGEDFIAGFRLINSYDTTTGISVVPRLLRLVCQNGMIMDAGFMKAYKYRHNQVFSVSISQYMEIALKDTINSNKKLRDMVETCMRDSIEWQSALEVIKAIFGSRKHFREIKELLPARDDITRWDIYNAVTNYATHGHHLTPGIEMMLNKQAQKILNTDNEKLIEMAIEVNRAYAEAKQ